MRLDGSDLRRLTSRRTTALSPAWSSTGRIAYSASDGDGNYALWTMRGDGSFGLWVLELAGGRPTRITTDAATPDWQPIP